MSEEIEQQPAEEPQLITRRGEERSTLRLLQRAINEGWDIPPEIIKAAPKVVGKVMVEGRTERDKLRAVECIATMKRDNLTALEKLHKAERLEHGESTENVRVEFPALEF